MKILLYESISAAYISPNKNNQSEYPLSLLQMGLSMRNALEEDLLKIKNISLIIGKHNEGENLNSYLNRIKTKIDAAWVVAPETKNKLIDAQQILSKTHWIGCERDALILTTKKSITKRKLLDFNILNPDSIVNNNSSSSGYVVKPDDGAGAENTTKFISLHDAIKKKKYCEDQGREVIIENFILGQSMSFSMLCFPLKTEVIAINKQIIDINKSGIISYLGVQRVNHKIESSLKNKIDKIAVQIKNAIPGLKGFIGVDFILDSNETIFVIEINPRITCAYIGLSKHLKRSIAEEIIKICT